MPPELIAKEPAEPRDSAKLMVIERDSGKTTHTVFKEILSFIPQGCNVIYNDTKVIKARLFGKKESGGAVELLINREIKSGDFSVLIKGKVKEQTVIEFSDTLFAKVVKLYPDGSRLVNFFDEKEKSLTLEELLPYLQKIGHTPLPPYIDRKDRDEDEKTYQSVFAKKEGAVAAPTASLHFSDKLFLNMRKKFNTSPITLHIGAGTFKPVDSDIITEHQIHSEYYQVPKKTASIIESNKAILAIGTTVTRTVEYYARTKKNFGECDLFLHPKNRPIRVNHLLTNFHLPKSTLIMLVASFLGLEKTLKVYNEAIEKRYRFYSYGDAMLIL